MTEYWVSQGNHWCDFCKIYLSNNPATIRNHELGTRHKDNVTKRIADMRKDKAAKEKKQQEAARSLEQIEAKAVRSYKKDLASQGDKDTHAAPADYQGIELVWEYDSSSGYYHDRHTGIHYDPKSGFYYSDVLGRWVTQEEAFTAAQSSSVSEPKKPLIKQMANVASGKKDTPKQQSGCLAPGLVITGSLNPTRSVKGAPSSVLVGKRKRPGEKTKAVSEEESAALKAREAARKRVEEREKSLLGLYGR
ncbi:zinc finger protein ZOP1 [Silene latifolia]|uniref:zinc finger protein ZOP1 n=1 Tax=Silene latifolia TaxID=37657 RepID=UPI003D782E44